METIAVTPRKPTKPSQPEKPPKYPDLAERMFRARHHREGIVGRKVPLREISADVSALLGLDSDYAPSVVARWVGGHQEPGTREQWVALATALSVDVGWLAFGDASAAPMGAATQETGARKRPMQRPQRGIVPRGERRSGDG